MSGPSAVQKELLISMLACRSLVSTLPAQLKGKQNMTVDTGRGLGVAVGILRGRAGPDSFQRPGTLP